MAFSAGETVKLKSGGKLMTVDTVCEDGSIDCVWFDGSEVKSHNFSAASLEPASKPKGGVVSSSNW